MKNCKHVRCGISFVLAALLAVSMVGCSKTDTDPSESSIPETTVIEETTGVTEPEEVEATEEAVATEPEEVVQVSSGTSKPSGGNTSKPSGNANKPSGNTNKPGGNTSKPSGNTNKPSGNTNKPSNIPPVIEGNGGFNHNTSKPEGNVPPVTEAPPVTEPPHVHSWVKHHHDAVGHWGKEHALKCNKCGWTCSESQAKAAGMDIYSYWQIMHLEVVDKNHSYSSFEKDTNEWIEDSPAYDEWVCSGCGSVSKTDPN